MNKVYNLATNSYVQSTLCAEIQGTVTTDPVPITIVNTGVQFTKAPDNIFVELGDTIPYTLTFKNTSDITINRIDITDVLPEGITLVASSLTVNGEAFVGDIQTGITLTNKLLPGGQVIVAFSGKVSNIPPTIYKNTATAKYYYQFTSTSSERSQTINSNMVTAKAIQGILFVTKAADKYEVQNKDYILYTITVVNEGNVEASDLVLTDILPPQVQYIPNTFKVGGVLMPEPINLYTGVKLGNLATGETLEVQFAVQVIDDSVPVVVNRGSISYYYQKDPNKPPNKNNTNSNPVPVEVINPHITIRKSTASTVVSAGQTVTYKLAIENSGTVKVDNVTVTDILPSGMSYVPKSLTVNGVPTAGDLEAGVNVGSIATGAIVTIGFKATVQSVPPNQFVNHASANFSYVINGDTLEGSEISNDVILYAFLLTVTKQVDKTVAQEGDKLSYTIIVNNKGKRELEKLEVVDLLDDNLTLVDGSLQINGKPVTGSLDGLVLPTLAAGSSATITFNATVNKGIAPTDILNSATVNYVGGDGKSYKATSNVVTTLVEHANCKVVLAARKTADKTQAKVDDIITFGITITNNGNKAAQNVILTDQLDKRLTLVPNSITIDGVPIHSNINQLSIGTIGVGKTINIVFQVQVTSGKYGEYIDNCTTISYTGCNNTMQIIQTNRICITIWSECYPTPCEPECPCQPRPPFPPCELECSCQPRPPFPPCEPGCPCQPRPPFPPCEPEYPCYPEEPCEPECPSCLPKPGCGCRMERVITSINLPSCIKDIDQIIGVSGFIKSVKPFSDGYCNKVMVIYVINLAYMSMYESMYTYQVTQKVCLETNQYCNHVEITCIEQPYEVGRRCIEVVVNMRVCSR